MFNMKISGVPNLDESASVTDYPWGKQKNDDPPGNENGTGVQVESVSRSNTGALCCNT